jgi:hypothetical protein
MTTPTTDQPDAGPAKGAADGDENLEALFDGLAQARADGTDRGEVMEKFDQQEPAPGQPAADASPRPNAAPANQAPAPTPPAIDWGTLPPAVKEQFEKLESERRAAVGRAAAAQREAASLKRRVEQMPPPAKPADGSSASAALDKEFPELAAALKEQVNGVATLFDQRLATATVQVKSEALNAVFPGWMETMKGDDFQFWLSTQPAETQRKFDGDSLGDYASLLRDFDASRTPAQQPQPQSEAARIRAEREARLSRTTVLAPRAAAPNPTGEPDAESDPEGYFNWLAAKRERAASRRP